MRGNPEALLAALEGEAIRSEEIAVRGKISVDCETPRKEFEKAYSEWQVDRLQERSRTTGSGKSGRGL